MARSKAQIRSDAKYRENNVKRFNLTFYPKDAPLYEHLRSQPEQNRYIRELIMADMGLTYEDLERMKPERKPSETYLPETFDWATTNEVCAALNVSRQRVHQLIKSGDLVSRKVGSRLQIRRDSLEEYISSKQ